MYTPRYKINTLKEDNADIWLSELLAPRILTKKEQEFYRFKLDSTTGEISRCEKIHGAGGRLYLTDEDGMSIWVTTKEICGEVVGIAGEYKGRVYVSGNFYYEKQDDGTVKEVYQVYSTSGTGSIREEGATFGYSY